MHYKEYIQSPKWRRKRRRYFKAFGRFCAACGTDEDITVHHISYDNFGAEKNDDLLTLCHEHHKLYHQEFVHCCMENLVLFLAEHQTPAARSLSRAFACGSNLLSH